MMDSNVSETEIMNLSKIFRTFISLSRMKAWTALAISLVVGDEFSESGGPAYAIAIHLTFIDPDKENEMWIHHFLSERQDTPKDPAGKFAEALAKNDEGVK